MLVLDVRALFTLRFTTAVGGSAEGIGKRM